MSVYLEQDFVDFMQLYDSFKYSLNNLWPLFISNVRSHLWRVLTQAAFKKAKEKKTKKNTTHGDSVQTW